MFKITEDEIALDALYETVLADENGAVAVFAGVVRNHTGGKRTDHLVYEAYPEMAEKKKRGIGG